MSADDTSANRNDSGGNDHRERLALLESKLDEAIEILLKRDNELTAAQRRILYLEELLDRHRVEYSEEP
ncbi:MAG: hypothetical protein FJ224_07980 [Lentisphaerae bacterium]|nr:hypothetical protein [Lentisphaerota bacterium]